MEVQDRSDLSRLHSLANGTVKSTRGMEDVRDASGSRWKNPTPTSIPVPTNTPRPSAMSNGRTNPGNNRLLGGPYSSKRMNSTLSKSSNPTVSSSNAIFLSHSKPPLGGKSGNNRRDHNKSKGNFNNVRTAPDPSEIIIVPDESPEDDWGKPLPKPGDRIKMQSSPDQLSMPGAFPTSSRPNHTQASTSGPAVKRKRSLSDDPISSFEEDAPHIFQRVSVKEEVNKIDQRDINNMTQVDLASEHQKMQKKKKQMKPKDPSSSTQKFQPVVSAAPRPSHSNRLPLHSLYLGYKCMDDRASSLQLFLERDVKTHKVLIKGYKGISKHATCTYNFHLDSGIEAVTVSTPQEKISRSILRLDTLKASKGRPYCDKPLSTQEFEPGGKHGIGHVMMKFDSDHDEWAWNVYTDLVTWLKSEVKETNLLDMYGTRSAWAMGESRSAMDTQQKRNKQERKPIVQQPKRAKSSIAKHTEVTSDAEDAASVQSGSVQSNTRAGSHQHPATPQENDSDDVVITERPLPPAPRRSARNSAVQSAQPSPDPDELILVYPPAATGAVNITNADYNRLEPGEYLNDTLIEFGLKLWLSKLQKTDPDLASQIHVFSSFFYKKLHNKNRDLGYESVRKWTAKFDLFSKKYLILPINEHLHWYLAIIYQPEHALSAATSAPLLPFPSTGHPRTRLSAALGSSDGFPVPMDTTVEVTTDVDVEALTTEHFDTGITEDVGVDVDIVDVDVDDDIVSNSADIGAMEPLNVLEEDIATPGTTHIKEETARPVTPEGFVKQRISESPLTDLDGMDVDDNRAEVADEAMGVESSTELMAGASINSLSIDDSDNHEVSATTFYGKTTYGSKGKKKQIRRPKATDVATVGGEGDVTMEADDRGLGTSSKPTTYIFTLDSLGGRHPQAISVLSDYLEKEAKHKKGRDKITKPVGVSAQVPAQPNYCDCGVYLLHFAETFMSAPDHFCQIITSKKSKTAIAQRKVEWKESTIGEYRRNMATTIEELSEEWKKDRAAKAEAKKAEKDAAETVQSSDSEVDILEVKTASPVKDKGKGKGKVKASQKPTDQLAAASRMRGG